MIVPAAGSDPSMAASLRSILSQTYPSFEVLLVTRDLEDPAASLIRKEIHGFSFARHLCSGKATACGQKNFNLLAGVAEASPESAILVFCDSVRVAPPDWLRALVEPIVKKRAVLTTGYHHIIPEDFGTATVGRALTVTVMHLFQSIPWITQPWGGAVAFERSTFFNLGIPEHWAEQVVDDISLVPLLKRSGVKAKLVPVPCLGTPLSGVSASGWSLWLARQIFYLKVSLVGSWIALGVICYHLAAMVVLAAARGIAGLMGWIPAGDGLIALGFLAALGALGKTLRTLHPNPGPWKPWLTAVYAAPLIAAWSHARTLFTLKIDWRGITYRVDWQGRVKSIQER
ncbi:MAG: glycosyltransferase [Syntrophobacteraceae bacterium]